MSFDITVGRRRMVFHQYGWRIEIQKTSEKGKSEGQIYWMEDRPAYPATLAHGLEMLLERTLTDGESIDIKDFPDAIRKALKTLEDCVRGARSLVK